MRKLLLEHASTKDIEKQAIAEGMTLLFEDGMRKVEEGITTFEEVMRVSRE